MKINLPTYLPMLLILLGSAISCTKPVELGQEIIEDDIIQVEVTDTLQVRARTITTERVRAFSQPAADFITLTLAPFGNMTDPVFGQARSELFLQLRLPKDQFGFPLDPRFDDDAVFDSLVLVLPYTESPAFGQIEGQTFGMDVTPLAQRLSPENDYFTDQSFPTTGGPLASVQFLPNFDSLEVVEYFDGEGDTISFAQLRVPLENSYGESIMQLDSLSFTGDSLFQEFLQGLELSPTLATNGLLNFNLSTGNGGLFLYYTREDTLPSQYQFPYSTPSVRTANYEHDHSGTPVAPYLDSDLDSLAFTQGMGGPMIELDFPQLASLNNVIVNYAQLELTVADLPGDAPDAFFPPDQLILSHRNEDGQLIVIDDIRLLTFDPSFPNEWAFDQSAILGSVLPQESFGGQLTAGSDGASRVYRFNLSSHLQRMIEGEVGQKIYLSIQPKAQTPARVSFRGSGSSLQPPRLLLGLTRL